MTVIRRTGAVLTPWLLRTPAADATALLFCLPYSGCGASMYRRWPRAVEGRRGRVEICPIQLPGREGRFSEPHFDTFPALADQLIEGLRPYLDRPFGFFGHCGSALAGYEACLRLSERGGPPAHRLFVSSQVAPGEQPYGRFLELSDAELAAEVKQLMSQLGVAQLDDLAEVYLEILRADLAANKYYRRPSLPLPHPITAIGWDRDTEIPPELMGGWHECGETEFLPLAGAHYQFLDPPPELLAAICRGFDLTGDEQP